jgi:uncharacterized membrane protein YgcG
MRFGQIFAVLGAILALVGGFGFPFYEMVYEGKTAFLYQVVPGLVVLLTALLVLPAAGYGFWFRKMRRSALWEVLLGVFGLGMLAFAAGTAPTLYRELYALPFDNEGNFTGFMKGGVGMFLVWGGMSLVLVGGLLTMISRLVHPKGTRFLRVSLSWHGEVLREHLFVDGAPVTVGSGLRNMFTVPSSFANLLLLRFKGGRRDHYWAALNDQLEGKVTIKGKTETIKDYKKKHTANTSGTDYVALSPTDSGFYRFGDLVLGFSFVEPAIGALKVSSGEAELDRRPLTAAFLLSFAVQVVMILGIAAAPRPITFRSRADEIRRKLIKIDLEAERKERERLKKLKEEEQLKEQKEEVKLEEEKVLEEEPEQAPTVEQKMQDAGDPLKKALDRKDEEFKPLKEGNIGKDAKRDTDMAKAFKDKGVISVLDSKMKRNTSLSKLLGKDRNLTMKMMVYSDDGTYEMYDERDEDFSYMGSSGGTGDYGGGGGFGGAGGYGGGGGGFGGGGAFGLGGMGGLGGGLPGGIGGAEDKAGRMALASLKDRDRKRTSRMKLGSGSMGQFCKKADVQRKVSGRAAAIRACYEMQLQMKPDLAGKVTLQWIIDLTGRVKGVKTVENSTGNKKLEDCISSIIGKVHFQQPEGGMCIIRWPFVFTPGE